MKSKKWIFTSWTVLSIERYEQFLENQAALGWHIQKSKWSFLFSQFIKTDISSTRYCIDYQPKVTIDYQSILTDDGWILVSDSSGWYLWKKDYTDQRPSLYTDRQSLIDRNQKLLMYHGLIFITQIPIFIIFMKKITENPTILWTILTYVYFIILILLGISGLTLLIANKKYKKKII